MLNARHLVGTRDVVFVTLDALRYDVAVQCMDSGATRQFARLLPGGQWEMRHSPGNFTYSAHQAFFAGFLPTPVAPGKHPRLFATRFSGSETTTEATVVFDAPDIVSGFRGIGYHTACIGGVGFFNCRTPLSRVFPALFSESHWEECLGVTDPRSTENQVTLACGLLSAMNPGQRVFLFVNVSAIHQPNCIFLDGVCEDGPKGQAAALAYVDRAMTPLWESLRSRGGALCVVCSDHGTAYGEDGYWGHRLSHPVVWTVPYAEFVLEASKDVAP
jgi:hypothetical protein